MPRISRNPCTVPSSPHRPCSAMKPASGAAAARERARFSAASISTTAWPRARSAAATAAPVARLTVRSALLPPLSTATFFTPSLLDPQFPLLPTADEFHFRLQTDLVANVNALLDHADQ